jgi:hypothetical protein
MRRGVVLMLAAVMLTLLLASGAAFQKAGSSVGQYHRGPGILTLVICGYLFGWKWTGLPKRTLWDWLQLLIIPAVLAAGGIWFNRQQRDRELEIAQRRTQDEALQAYLNEVSQLLTDKEQPLHKARPGDSLSAVARARTLAVLPGLDGHQNRSFFFFRREYSSTSLSSFFDS